MSATVKILISVLIVLGVSLPIFLLFFLRDRGLDVWNPKTPLILSDDKKRTLRFFRRMRNISLLLLIPILGWISATEGDYVRPIGLFIVLIGVIIAVTGFSTAIKGEYKFSGRGTALCILGVTAKAFGWFVGLFGTAILLFGASALVLPFGFFA